MGDIMEELLAIKMRPKKLDEVKKRHNYFQQ